MKKTMLTVAAAFIVMGTMVASVEEANAVVCARGLYRVGCAGPRGASSFRAGLLLLRAGSSCGAPFIETLLC